MNNIKALIDKYLEERRRLKTVIDNESLPELISYYSTKRAVLKQVIIDLITISKERVLHPKEFSEIFKD